MKVRVTSAVTLTISPVANVHYEAGFEGSVPKAHVERIEAAGAGHRVADERRDDASAKRDGEEAA